MQDIDFIRTGSDALQTTWDVALKGQWEALSEQDDIFIESQMRDGRRIFKGEMRVSASPSRVFHLLHDAVERHEEWNSNLISSRVLHTIDSHTDVLHSVECEMAGGLVRKMGLAP